MTYSSSEPPQQQLQPLLTVVSVVIPLPLLPCLRLQGQFT